MKDSVKIMIIIWSLLAIFAFVSSFYLPSILLKIGMLVFSAFNVLAMVGMFSLMNKNKEENDYGMQLQETDSSAVVVREEDTRDSEDEKKKKRVRKTTSK